MFRFDKRLNASIENQNDTLYIILRGKYINIDSNTEIDRLGFYKWKGDYLYANHKRASKRDLIFLFMKPQYYVLLLQNKHGVKIEEGYYQGENRRGYCKTYYLNGNVKSEGVYIVYERVGKWSFYDESGKLKSTEYFNSEDCKLLGTRREYPKL